LSTEKAVHFLSRWQDSRHNQSRQSTVETGSAAGEAAESDRSMPLLSAAGGFGHNLLAGNGPRSQL